MVCCFCVRVPEADCSRSLRCPAELLSLVQNRLCRSCRSHSLRCLFSRWSGGRSRILWWSAVVALALLSRSGVQPSSAESSGWSFGRRPSGRRRVSSAICCSSPSPRPVTRTRGHFCRLLSTGCGLAVGELPLVPSAGVGRSRACVSPWAAPSLRDPRVLRVQLVAPVRRLA